MAWKITFGEKSMLLDDLTEDDFMAACAGLPETNWLRVYNSPASNPTAYYRLLGKVAQKLQVPTPDKPQTVKQTVALLDHIEQVDDDLPNEFGEGGIPLEEVAPATHTSSTSTEPEGGIPTSLAA